MEHDKPIDDLVDKIAQRAWTIDGVKSEGHKIPGEPGAVVARLVVPLTADEIFNIGNEASRATAGMPEQEREELMTVVEEIERHHGIRE